jgi:ElaB/YqjD/DUF883 family membrane-anchored ribosome-binding protein
MKNNKVAAHTPRELLEELKTLVGEAETMLVGSLSESSAEALSNLRERFSVVQERLSDVYDGARKKVAAGAKYTDESIRENPYQSLAIVLGVGVLVGVLIGRRSK